ncbi:hypothetical protein DL769_005686 [Monosporascus sp. CRB-8-3]|nr:hypothetical protein DL769_005686 [Monosporascus sp. CRB-8-3]
MCTFTGDATNSNAAKDPCTDTTGYISNIEIEQIKNSNVNPDLYGERMVKQFHDDSSSNILVYDDTEWVSYLEPKPYHLRAAEIFGNNFGGTSDWAVDLQ